MLLKMERTGSNYSVQQPVNPARCGCTHSRPAQQQPTAGVPHAFCKVAPSLSRYYAAPWLTIAQETSYAPSTLD